jgi:hypothetical protein
MAERWIKVEVRKTLTSEVYLRIDDAAVPVTPCVLGERAAKHTGRPNRSVTLTAQISRLARDAALDAYDLDWEGDDEIIIGRVVEVTRGEAERQAAND